MLSNLMRKEYYIPGESYHNYIRLQGGFTWQGMSEEERAIRTEIERLKRKIQEDIEDMNEIDDITYLDRTDAQQDELLRLTIQSESRTSRLRDLVRRLNVLRPKYKF